MMCRRKKCGDYIIFSRRKRCIEDFESNNAETGQAEDEDLGAGDADCTN